MTADQPEVCELLDVFGLCAEFQQEKMRNRIWLYAQDQHRDLIQQLLNGADYPDAAGFMQLRNCFLDELGYHYIPDILINRAFGPWPWEFQSVIGFEPEPNLQLTCFHKPVKNPSAWAWIWLPSFSQHPSILIDVIRALGQGLERSSKLVNDIISERLPMPFGMEISTSSFIERHPYGSARTENLAVSPAIKHELPQLRGGPGRHRRVNRAEIVRAAVVVLIQRPDLSVSELAHGVSEVLGSGPNKPTKKSLRTYFLPELIAEIKDTYRQAKKLL